jgi:PAS domain-containing protein
LAIDEATTRLIDALMEPIVAVDSAGLIVAVNREASSLFGYGPSTSSVSQWRF